MNCNCCGIEALTLGLSKLKICCQCGQTYCANCAVGQFSQDPNVCDSCCLEEFAVYDETQGLSWDSDN